MSSIDQGDKVTDTDTGSAEAIAELRAGLKELQDSVREWRAAETPKERAAARDDVDEAQEDLEAVAKRLGISKDALAKATAEAKRTEQKEAFRPILAELLEEMVGDDDEQETPATDEPAPPAPEPVEKKREPKPKPEPDEDTPPAQEHWIDKRIRF